MNLRWSWDEPTRDLFRWVDKDAWEAMSHDPVRLLGQVPRPRLDQLAADPGFLRYLQETEDGLHRYLTGPPLVPDPGRDPAGQPAAAGGLLLAGVRHLRGAAAVLRRPGGAGRRPPEGVERPRRPPRRRRALLPLGLLQPAADRRRHAAGAVLRAGPRRAGPDPLRRHPHLGRPGRRAPAGAGLAGRRRPRPAVPARQRRGRQHPRGPGRHRPALRRRHRAPHPPGDPPRHRRGAGAAGPRPRPAGLPHQRGPRRLPRAGAGRASWWPAA